MSLRKAAAIEYAKRGWKVFPIWWVTEAGSCACRKSDCGRLGKHPHGKLVPRGFKDAVSDVATVEAWWTFAPEANIGLATGDVWVLDIDSPAAEEALTVLDPLPVTLEARTGGGGRHLFFERDDRVGSRQKIRIGGVKVDLDCRGKGGYVLLPPSNHEKGDYAWANQEPITKAPEWLIELVTSAKATSESPQEPARAEPEGEFVFQVGSPQTQEEQLEIARRCLAALKPGRCSDRDDWIAVGQCLHSIDEGDRGFEMWKEWSKGCPEKYDESDCRYRWDSFAGGGRTLGTLIYLAKEDGWEPEREEEANNTTNQDDEEFLARLRPKRASELADQLSSLDWIWQGYLAPGLVTILIGFWKSGKSTLVGHLLKTMSQGGELAGKVAPSKVLVVSEETEARWSRRIKELGIGEEHVGYVCKPLDRRFSRQEWAKAVAYWADLCEAEGYRLLVVDTISNFWPVEDENSERQQADALLPFGAFRDRGIAVLLAHHPRKGKSDLGQGARGSGYLQGWADIIFEFHVQGSVETSRKRKLVALSREEDTPRRQIIELTEDGYRRAQDEEVSRLDVVLLVIGDECLTNKEIADRWPEEFGDIDAKAVQKVTKKAFEDGLLVREGEGMSSDPFRYRQAP